MAREKPQLLRLLNGGTQELSPYRRRRNDTNLPCERGGREPLWTKIISELEELPTALCCVGNDLHVEYVYVIDLDNELFSVDNHVYFNLWDIPRDRWVQASTIDDEGRKFFSSETCPEGFFSISVDHQYFIGHFNETSECDKYNSLGQRYIYSTIANSTFPPGFHYHGSWHSYYSRK